MSTRLGWWSMVEHGGTWLNTTGLVEYCGLHRVRRAVRAVGGQTKECRVQQQKRHKRARGSRWESSPDPHKTTRGSGDPLEDNKFCFLDDIVMFTSSISRVSIRRLSEVSTLRRPAVARHWSRSGHQRVKVEHSSAQLIDDAFFTLLRWSWPSFLLVMCGGYTLCTLLFAVLLLAEDRPISSTDSDGIDADTTFGDAFYFSVQTFSTIGFGTLSPTTVWGDAVVTIESFISLVMITLGAGLLFARVSRPRARVAFSNCCTVTEVNGMRYLILRLVNERSKSHLLDVTAKLSALVPPAANSEGSALGLRGVIEPLHLERNNYPILASSWQLIHRIDEHSPLHGITAETASHRMLQLFVLLVGTDEVYVSAAPELPRRSPAMLVKAPACARARNA